MVIVRVSKGGSILPVPDVRGLKFEEGVKRLSEAGFKVDKIIRVADKLKPAGSIIAQNPAAPQQVAANCMVSLLVSSGGSGSGAFVNVPDLKGQAPDVVAQVLEQIGLTVGSRTETPSAEVPAGTVLRTNPRNGANVPARNTDKPNDSKGFKTWRGLLRNTARQRPGHSEGRCRRDCCGQKHRTLRYPDEAA